MNLEKWQGLFRALAEGYICEIRTTYYSERWTTIMLTSNGISALLPQSAFWIPCAVGTIVDWKLGEKYDLNI